ncbi:MAG: hypothetical protein Q7S50_03435 [bacterium]|nr:hypothetical protein [bacterium]
MWQKRAIALVILIVGTGIGWYVYSSEHTGSRPFKLGLDLSGGTQLVYNNNVKARP